MPKDRENRSSGSLLTAVNVGLETSMEQSNNKSLLLTNAVGNPTLGH